LIGLLKHAGNISGGLAAMANFTTQMGRGGCGFQPSRGDMTGLTHISTLCWYCNRFRCSGVRTATSVLEIMFNG